MGQETTVSISSAGASIFCPQWGQVVLIVPVFFAIGGGCGMGGGEFGVDARGGAARCGGGLLTDLSPAPIIAWMMAPMLPPTAMPMKGSRRAGAS